MAGYVENGDHLSIVGFIPLSTYMKVYKVGDFVDVKV